MTVADEIISRLKERPNLSAGRIASQLGKSEQHVQQELSLLARTGRVVRMERSGGRVLFAAVPSLTKRFEDAFSYAAELHRRQARKGTGIPYISHVLAVASLVWEAGGNEDEAIAGLLHDGPEDCGGRQVLDEIRRRFGAAVSDIVEGCTDTFEDPKPNWLTRKTAYIERLAHDGPSIHLVSSADKLHNARAIIADVRRDGSLVWDRFSAKPDRIVWYYESLCEAYRTAGHSPLVEELGLAVREMKALI